MPNQLPRPNWAGEGWLDSGVFDRPALSGHVFYWFLEDNIFHIRLKKFGNYEL